MEHEHKHRSHPEVANRLKRAEGHLRSVIAMIESGRSCLDIATQMHAVERAISQAKRTLIEDHLDSCLTHAAEPLDDEARRQFDEFRQIARFL